MLNQKVPNQAIRFICIEDAINLVLYWKQAIIISYFLTCSFLSIVYCWTKHELLAPLLNYKEIILLPAGIYLLKVKNENTRKRSKICQELTKKDTRTTSIDMNTQLVDVALVSFLKFEHILLLALLFLYVKLELVNDSWKFIDTWW